MRKFALAAILALPFTAIGVQKASAWGCACKSCGEGGGCTPTYRIGFSLGLCWRGWCKCDHLPCDPCGAKAGPCGLCCNPFVGGYGPMPPWYQYYPSAPGGASFPISFPTPAPTGFPYGAGGSQSPVGSPLFGANFSNVPNPAQVMPCGYSPQGAGYWYGH